jgi:ABC-type lipoprotein export system ATPase subunit
MHDMLGSLHPEGRMAVMVTHGRENTERAERFIEFRYREVVK